MALASCLLRPVQPRRRVSTVDARRPVALPRQLRDAWERLSCRGERAAGPSIVNQEVHKFNAVAAAWWDPKGSFKPLHALNPTRVAFIRDALCDSFGHARAASTTPWPRYWLTKRFMLNFILPQFCPRVQLCSGLFAASSIQRTDSLMRPTPSIRGPGVYRQVHWYVQAR